MNRHQFASTAIALLLLSSCGGGGGNSEGNPLAAASGFTSHSIQLGPIVGASVTIYQADCKSPLYLTTTDQDGNYSVEVARLRASLGSTLPELLCIEAVGGKDIDPNDDGVRGVGEEISLQGAIRGFVRTQDVLEGGGTKVNLFGAAIADVLKESGDITGSRIAQIAEQFSVPDVDKDGKITIADVTRYQMGSGSNGEASLRDFYLRTLHTNDTAGRQAYVDSTLTTLSGIRQEVRIMEAGETRLVLTSFSPSSTIRYGRALATTLPNIYSVPIAIAPNEVIFMQECTNSGCLPKQSIQIAPSGKKIMEYSDTGGIDFSEQIADQTRRAAILTQMETDRARVVSLSSDLVIKTAALKTAQEEIDQIASDNRLLDAEIARLQNPD